MRLKITDADYKTLEKAINKIEKKYPNAKDNYTCEIRYKWDVYFTAIKEGYLSQKFIESLNEYLNGSNIGNALKYITNTCYGLNNNKDIEPIDWVAWMKGR